MSGGSSSGKGFGGGRRKGLRKGPPIVWEGPVGPEIYPEPVFEFPVQSKSEFTTTKPLRGYDNRKEDWPKCMHGEDCVVQMMTEGEDGSRRLFKCPRAWVRLNNLLLLHVSHFIPILYPRYMFQSSADSDGCGFVRWVDPAPIHPHQEYIEYLQNHIFDLEMNIGDNGTEDDDNNNVAVAQATICYVPSRSICCVFVSEVSSDFLCIAFYCDLYMCTPSVLEVVFRL